MCDLGVVSNQLVYRGNTMGLAETDLRGRTAHEIQIQIFIEHSDVIFLPFPHNLW